jgi:hypothetical protein
VIASLLVLVVAETMEPLALETLAAMADLVVPHTVEALVAPPEAYTAGQEAAVEVVEQLI